MNARRIAAFVIGSLVVAACAAPAAADTPPTVTGVGVPGCGPDDLLWFAATGLTPGADATPRLVVPLDAGVLVTAGAIAAVLLAPFADRRGVGG